MKWVGIKKVTKIVITIVDSNKDFTGSKQVWYISIDGVNYDNKVLENHILTSGQADDFYSLQSLLGEIKILMKKMVE